MVRVHGSGPGGRRRLAELLTEHGEAIEADLAEYYAVDLGDLFRGRLSWRRLGVLIRGLPVESRFVSSLPRTTGVDTDDSTASRWSHQEYILADLYDLLLAAHSRDHSAKPYPRPRHRVVRRRADPARVAELRRRTGREVV
ncbi:MAG: hypothetical protein AB7I38_14460 [Dehalococcoidia bacterium]